MAFKSLVRVNSEVSFMYLSNSDVEISVSNFVSNWPVILMMSRKNSNETCSILSFFLNSFSLFRTSELVLMSQKSSEMEMWDTSVSSPKLISTLILAL